RGGLGGGVAGGGALSGAALGGAFSPARTLPASMLAASATCAEALGIAQQIRRAARGSSGSRSNSGRCEFGHENRPEGWNVWLTFAISPAAAPPPITQTSMVRK